MNEYNKYIYSNFIIYYIENKTDLLFISINII